MKLKLIKACYILIMLFTSNINGYFKDKETTYPIVLEDQFPGEISINSFAWSADGNFIAVIYFNDPKICKIFDSFSGEIKLNLETCEDISSLAWSFDNKYLAIGLLDGVIEIRDIEENYQIINGFECDGNIAKLRWHPIENYLCAEVHCAIPQVKFIKATRIIDYEYVNRINLYDTTKFTYLGTLHEFHDDIIDIQWNATGNFLVVAFEYSLSMRFFSVDFKNIVNSAILHLLPPFKYLDLIHSLVWLPNYKYGLLICMNGRQIKVCDLSNLDKLKIIKDYENTTDSGQISCSQDGAYLALTESNIIKIYNLKTFSKNSTIEICNSYDISKYNNKDRTFLIDKIAWSPKGPFIAVAARDSESVGSHILLILNVNDLYFSPKKLLERDIGESN